MNKISFVHRNARRFERLFQFSIPISAFLSRFSKIYQAKIFLYFKGQNVVKSFKKPSEIKILVQKFQNKRFNKIIYKENLH